MLSPTTPFVELSGIHHLTAISVAIRENHRFYTKTLGMRLVKRTVNQDDVTLIIFSTRMRRAAQAQTSRSSAGGRRESAEARGALFERVCA